MSSMTVVVSLKCYQPRALSTTFNQYSLCTSTYTLQVPGWGVALVWRLNSGLSVPAVQCAWNRAWAARSKRTSTRNKIDCTLFLIKTLERHAERQERAYKRNVSFKLTKAFIQVWLFFFIAELTYCLGSIMSIHLRFILILLCFYTVFIFWQLFRELVRLLRKKRPK